MSKGKPSNVGTLGFVIGAMIFLIGSILASNKEETFLALARAGVMALLAIAFALVSCSEK